MSGDSKKDDGHHIGIDVTTEMADMDFSKLICTQHTQTVEYATNT